MDKNKLYIDKNLEKILETRVILHSDIIEVINHSEENKEYFKKPENGNIITSYITENTVFWVEYTKEKNGYKVHNAYSHRMKFKKIDE